MLPFFRFVVAGGAWPHPFGDVGRRSPACPLPILFIAELTPFHYLPAGCPSCLIVASTIYSHPPRYSPQRVIGGENHSEVHIFRIAGYDGYCFATGGGEQCNFCSSLMLPLNLRGLSQSLCTPTFLISCCLLLRSSIVALGVRQVQRPLCCLVIYRLFFQRKGWPVEKPGYHEPVLIHHAVGELHVSASSRRGVEILSSSFFVGSDFGK